VQEQINQFAYIFALEALFFYITHVHLLLPLTVWNVLLI